MARSERGESVDRLEQASLYLQRFKFVLENLPKPAPPLIEAIDCLGAAVDALAAELESIKLESIRRSVYCTANDVSCRANGTVPD